MKKPYVEVCHQLSMPDLHQHLISIKIDIFFHHHTLQHNKVVCYPPYHIVECPLKYNENQPAKPLASFSSSLQQ